MSQIFLLVIVLAATFDLGRACSCAWQHPQQHACSADFVILARILSRKPTTDPEFPQASYTGYKLKITQVFKSNKESDSALLRTRFITTASEGSLCGATDLKIKQLYLITGKVYEGRANINICNFVQPWNSLSIVQRKGFRTSYYDSCDCKVKQCGRYSTCTNPGNQGCFWNTNDACEENHSVCTRHAHGMCDWQENKYFQHCTDKKSGKHNNEAFNHRRIDP